MVDNSFDIKENTADYWNTTSARKTKGKILINCQADWSIKLLLL